MKRGLALLLAVALPGCTPMATVRDLVTLGPVEPVLVIQNANVFPATGTDVLAGFDVIVVDQKIAALQPTGGSLPAGAVVVDGSGKTLLPGLVDAHTHVTGTGAVPWRRVTVPPEHNLEAWLYAGVTTVYDLGGPGLDLEELQQRIVRGEVDGPRLFHTDLLITAPGGHPIPVVRALTPWPLDGLVSAVVPQAEGPDDAEALIGEMIDKGADYVKLDHDHVPADGPALDDETLTALVRAAHARHKKVFVHVGSADDALAAVQAGADVLAHGVYRGALTLAQAETIQRSGASVIVTLAAFHHIADMVHERLIPSALDEQTTAPEILSPLKGAAAHDFNALPAMSALTRDLDASQGLWADNVRALVEARVPIVVGSDGVLPGVWAGGTIHEEMKLLVDAGVPAVDVLLGATSRAARLFLDAPDFGTIEAGKTADLLLVDGDPTTDITATARIVAVVRSGRLVTRHVPVGEAATGQPAGGGG